MGEFKNGMFHGHGSLHLEGGTLYVAEWEDGKVASFICTPSSTKLSTLNRCRRFLDLVN